MGLLNAKEAGQIAADVIAHKASFECRLQDKLDEISVMVDSTAKNGLRGFAVYVTQELSEKVVEALKALGYRCFYAESNHSLSISF
jgi:hypothetical protein